MNGAAVRGTDRTPSVGVAIASFRERTLLDACLESLLPQSAELRASVVVARTGSPEEIAELEQTYPDVRFVRAPSGTGLPQLRAMGLAAADGETVALTEDHCVAAAGWLSRLAQAEGDVVGGAMDNARRERPIDWAAYFSEYGLFAGGAGSVLGRTPQLTGANVAYRRSVIDTVIRLANRGEWENVVHDHLAAEGYAVRFLRDATISQNLRYSFWAFCRDRYEHGRDYARRRLVDEHSRRWTYFFGAPALPFILTRRVARSICTSHRRPFRRALPFTFAFLTAWAGGEAVGYWRGPREAE